MAFTLNQAITEVRSLINEASAGYFSDTEITSWIQQGCLDWCEKSLLLTQEDTITLVTNTYKYTTSTSSYIGNAIKALHVEYNGKALQRVTYEQLRGHNALVLASDPAPKYYYDAYRGTTYTFYLGPVPTSTYNGGTVTILWALRTDDITDIQYEYQPSVFLFAASRAKIKERQYREAALLVQTYINNIQFARQDSLEAGQKPTDDYRIK